MAALRWMAALRLPILKKRRRLEAFMNTEALRHKDTEVFVGAFVGSNVQKFKSSSVQMCEIG